MALLGTATAPAAPQAARLARARGRPGCIPAIGCLPCPGPRAGGRAAAAGVKPPPPRRAAGRINRQPARARAEGCPRRAGRGSKTRTHKVSHSPRRQCAWVPQRARGATQCSRLPMGPALRCRAAPVSAARLRRVHTSFHLPHPSIHQGQCPERGQRLALQPCAAPLRAWPGAPLQGAPLPLPPTGSGSAHSARSVLRAAAARSRRLLHLLRLVAVLDKVQLGAVAHAARRNKEPPVIPSCCCYFQGAPAAAAWMVQRSPSAARPPTQSTSPRSGLPAPATWQPRMKKFPLR